jgi:hypothetical protein
MSANSTNWLKTSPTITKQFAVMGLTVPPSQVFSITKRTKSTGTVGIIHTSMFKMIGKNKIIWGIICLNTIIMMDYLSRSKRSAQLLFHNNNMFKNISVFSSPRMTGNADHNISLARFNISTALPARVKVSIGPVSIPTFSTKSIFFSTFHICWATVINKLATVVARFSKHTTMVIQGEY